MKRIEALATLPAEHAAWLPVAAYAASIIAAEVLLVAVGPVASLAVHGILLVLLAIQAASLEQPQRLVYSALMLHPLLRVISLGLPTNGLSLLAEVALLGLPLWIGLVTVAYTNQLTPADLGLKPNGRSWGWQVALGLAGWPLGLVAALIIRPAPAISALTPAGFVIGAVIITVFSSAAEEVLFRGILQTALYRSFGNYGIVCAGLMFAAAYAGTQSVPFVFLMAVVGLVFGWATQRTGSLWAAIVAHSLLKCGALLIWPFILR